MHKYLISNYEVKLWLRHTVIKMDLNLRRISANPCTLQKAWFSYLKAYTHIHVYILGGDKLLLGCKGSLISKTFCFLRLTIFSSL